MTWPCQRNFLNGNILKESIKHSQTFCSTNERLKKLYVLLTYRDLFWIQSAIDHINYWSNQVSGVHNIQRLFLHIWPSVCINFHAACSLIGNKDLDILMHWLSFSMHTCLFFYFLTFENGVNRAKYSSMKELSISNTSRLHVGVEYDAFFTVLILENIYANFKQLIHLSVIHKQKVILRSDQLIMSTVDLSWSFSNWVYNWWF